MNRKSAYIILILLFGILFAGCVNQMPKPQETAQPQKTPSTEARDWNMMGINLTIAGRYDEAIDAFSRAIALEPDYYEAWRNNATTLMEAGRYEEALASIDRLIEMDPKRVYHWYLRGKVLMELERYDEAVKAFDIVLSYDSENEEVKQLRSLALAKLQK